MKGRIYLLNPGAELAPMTEEPYDSEAILQELLATHPDLLAGEQIDSDNPRRWLLVKREMEVGGNEDAAARWSIDHLFLDQDGIPTLVEVKRSSDTRIRREVVGQLLDYAANAVAHWPVEEIQAKFATLCQANGSDPDELLADLLEDQQDPAELWQRVKTNLQAGRVRLVFVADRIPPELRRVVEFLNQQMDPAEVLAVEVKQFVGEGVKTLVPRVIGQTESARAKKAATRAPQRQEISEAEFLAEFDGKRPPAEHAVVRDLIAWASKANLRVGFTRGNRGAEFGPCVDRGERALRPIAIPTRGTVTFPMRQLKGRSPFNDPAKRDQLQERLQRLPDLRTTEAGMEGYPQIPIESLTDPKVMQDFVSTLDWLVAELRAAGDEVA